MSAADRARLAAIAADRNRPQKHVRRAQVVLLTADQVGTGEIMRRTGLSKPSVWRWQHVNKKGHDELGFAKSDDQTMSSAAGL